jgi:hypothetical protein
MKAPSSQSARSDRSHQRLKRSRTRCRHASCRSRPLRAEVSDHRIDDLCSKVSPAHRDSLARCLIWPVGIAHAENAQLTFARRFHTQVRQRATQS